MKDGETIASGAPSTCEDCHLQLTLKVLSSPAGYYLGTHCDCGPYSRETGYYPDRATAERELASHDWVPRGHEQEGLGPLEHMILEE